MALLLFILVAMSSCVRAIIEARVITYANTTVSPAIVTSTSTGLTTSAQNASSASATLTSHVQTASGSTCCYIVNYNIGVNTWYTNTANITVATAITNWIQYDDTVVVGDVTTVFDPVATSIYGTYMQGSIGDDHPYTTVAYETDLTTETIWISPSSDADTGTHYRTTTFLTTLESVLFTTVSVPSAIPTTLLHQSAPLDKFAQYYQAQWIGTQTAMTFTEQDLTIYSPTPYYLYSTIGVLTSALCVDITTTTKSLSWVSATIGGTATLIQTTVPPTTRTFYPAPIPAQIPWDVTMYATVAQPFPSGVYTNWTYDTFIAEKGLGIETFGENIFDLPEGLPEVLAGIPELVSSYPDIGSCTNGIGHGEPTIHVPVNELTTEMHTTRTVSGKFNKVGTTIMTTSETTTPKDAPSAVNQATATAGATSTAAAEQQATGGGGSNGPLAGSGGSSQGTESEVDTNLVAGSSVVQQGSSTTPGNNAQPPATGSLTSAKPADQGSLNTATTSSIVFTYIQPEATAAVTIGSAVVIQNSASALVIGTATVSLGGPAVAVGGTTVSMASGASAVIINGQTSNLGGAKSTPAIVIGSATLVAGGAVATVDGTTIALANGGSAIVVNGQTSQLGAPASAPLIVGTAIAATPGASGGFVLPGGQTLTSGGVVVESGTIYAVGPSGGLVANGQSASTIPSSELAVNGAIITATPTNFGSGNGYVIAGQTLTSGDVVTVAGQAISMASGGGIIAVQSGSSGDAIASAIMNIFGTGSASQSGNVGSPSTSSTAPVPYTGDAGSMYSRLFASSLAIGMLFLAVMWL